MPTRLTALAAAIALSTSLIAPAAPAPTTSANAAAHASVSPLAPVPAHEAPQPLDHHALDGVWIYQEDRTEGRAPEEHGPPMSARTTLRAEDDAIILVRSDGEIRMALDGSPTDLPREGFVSRYTARWSDGAFTYDIESIRADGSRSTPLRIQLRPTPDGMLARVVYDIETDRHALALYRHPEDIPLPTPAAATIDDVAWLAGDWVGATGTGGATSIEERWSPPLGGAMLAVSRTVRGGSLRAFEFLRIVQRDAGLVYIAQPNGGAATTFTLTEISGTRAVFDNPRHDSPQRITYERTPEGGLTASIGFINGGRPRAFEYTREPADRP